MAASLLKQYASLVKNVSSFTDAQVEVIQDNSVGDEDSLSAISVVFSPKGGLYRGGKFIFCIEINNNGEAPIVTCKTPIYHPNIDVEGEVCLNLLDDLWTSNTTLEDIVQGILFLFYNPNLEDPLSDLIDGLETYEFFKKNVQRSLRGETIDCHPFERNLPEDFEEEEEEEELEVRESEKVEGGELDCCEFMQRMFAEEDINSSSFVQQMVTDEEEDQNRDLSCPGPESGSETNSVSEDNPDEPCSNLQSGSSLANHFTRSSTTDGICSHVGRYSRTLLIHTSALARLFKRVTCFFDRMRYLFSFRILFWNSFTYRTQTLVR